MPGSWHVFLKRFLSKMLQLRSSVAEVWVNHGVITVETPGSELALE